MRPLDIHERLDRIEERMATRDDIAALHEEIVRTRRSPLRRLVGAAFWTAIALGSAVLGLVFADRMGVSV